MRGIADSVKGLSIKLNAPIDDKLRSIKFSAIVSRRNELALIDYVTGSTIGYYRGSIARASVNFEISNEVKLTKYIKTKIALIDDTANGYHKTTLSPHLEHLKNVTKNNVILWQNKETITQAV